MGELLEFQFRQNMALEDPVVKDKVHEVVRIPDQNLDRDPGEPGEDLL